jgi:hypothetical protein
MLEILLLFKFTSYIGSVVEQKGYRAGKYKAIAVALWFGGEILGAVLGALLDLGMGTYLLALLFAAGGALVAHSIAKSLPALESAEAKVFD